MDDINVNVDVAINTYQTKYENELKSWYGNKLVKILINDNLIGLENLLNNALKEFSEINNYDFILALRIDLFIKDLFFENLKEKIFFDKILFPFICWIGDHKCHNSPRVSDTLLFIPKKYFYLIEQRLYLSHNAWFENKQRYNLDKNDMDFIIYTFHDSDSEKDFNSLYYMVSRNETTKWRSGPNIIYDQNKDINSY